MVFGALHAEGDEIADMQLEVVDRLLCEQHAVAMRGEQAHRPSGIVVGEERIRQVGGVGDRHGIDAEDVLEIGADVGEPVHHRPCRFRARHTADDAEELASRICRRSGHGHVGSVGERGVYRRLCVVGGVEHRRGHGE